MNAVPLLSQKLLQKNLFRKNGYLWLEILLFGGQILDLTSNLRICSRKSVKRAIECAFPGHCSSLGSRVVPIGRKMLKTTKFDRW